VSGREGDLLADVARLKAERDAYRGELRHLSNVCAVVTTLDAEAIKVEIDAVLADPTGKGEGE
jgi:hypothetical protein